MPVRKESVDPGASGAVHREASILDFGAPRAQDCRRFPQTVNKDFVKFLEIDVVRERRRDRFRLFQTAGR